MIAAVWQDLKQRSLDPWIVGGVLALSLLGIVMVMSASLQIAEINNNDPFYFFKRHLVYWAMAISIGVFTYVAVPFNWFRRIGFLGFLIALVSLLLLFIPGLGRSVNGSLRWLNLAGLTVQPSEIAKFFFITYLAGYIIKHYESLMTSWQSFLAPLGLLGIIGLALLMQPDFGAFTVITVATLSLLFLAGAPMMRFLVIAGSVVGLGALVAVAQPYRVARLMSFMNPWEDPFGSGYQLTQSLIAFGRGGWFGVGIGNSVQKLFYLPEAHTDFISAVIAEELGLIGNLAIVALFVLVVGRMFFIAQRLAKANWWYQALCIYGFAVVFSTQAIVNLGVSMGILPTKGLTLPFVSYGGSSLLVSAAMVALALRADADLRWAEKQGGGR